MNEQFKIVPLTTAYLAQVKEFTDRWIGKNYYQMEELQLACDYSRVRLLNCSFVALNGDEMVGIRLTYAPGEWVKKARSISPEKWGADLEKVGYFKSLFIHEDFQQNGLGRQLSGRSLEVLANMGAQAVICHSWLESPNNSSQRYLQNMGFRPVNEHPLFWHDIDYQCTRCAPQRCQCTAVEMIKYLSM
jgi:predicted N-acetyltransferase YhbS